MVHTALANVKVEAKEAMGKQWGPAELSNGVPKLVASCEKHMLQMQVDCTKVLRKSEITMTMVAAYGLELAVADRPLAGVIRIFFMRNTLLLRWEGSLPAPL